MAQDIEETGKSVTEVEFWKWRHAVAVLELTQAHQAIEGRNVKVNELKLSLTKANQKIAELELAAVQRKFKTAAARTIEEKNSYDAHRKALAEKYNVEADKMTIDDETLEIGRVVDLETEKK